MAIFNSYVSLPEGTILIKSALPNPACSQVTRRDQANSPGNDRFQDENDVFSSYTRLVDHPRIISRSPYLTVKSPSKQC